MKNLLPCILALLLAVPAAAQNKFSKYDIDLRIEPEQRLMEETVEVELPPANAERKVLRMGLAEQMGELKLEVIQPAECAGPARLSKGASMGGTTIWQATPVKPVPANEPVQLKATCHGGDKTAFVFHIGPEGCFAGGTNTTWYPMFDLGTGPTISMDERPLGIGHIRMTVPKGITAMACGKKVGESEAGDHTVFDYQVDTPCMFGFAAAKFFVHRVEGGIPVTVFFFKDRPNVQDYVNGCHRVIEELTKIYGKFPFAEFAVVEVDDDRASDAGFSGASLPGFMLANGSFLNEPFNLAYFGHEIGHTWWGNVIGSKGNEGGMMLSEGMAQYGSLRVVSAVDGPEMAARYRESGFPGYIKEQCGQGYMGVSVSGYDQKLLKMQGGYAHLLADCKGFLVLDQLERVIGRKAMDAALRNVVAQHAFGSVSWKEFADEFAKQSGMDLGWFWDQWMNRLGAPVLDVSWSADHGSIRGALTQTAPAYKLRVPVQVLYDDGTADMHIIDANSLSTSFEFRTGKKVSSIKVDPQFEILHLTPEGQKYWEGRKPLLELMYLVNFKQDEAGAKAREILAEKAAVDSAGLQFAAHFALGVLAQPKDPAGAQKEYEAAIACPVRVPTLLPRCYLRLARVCLKLGDKDRAAWAARAVIGVEKSTGDSDYSSDAESLLSEINKSK